MNSKAHEQGNACWICVSFLYSMQALPPRTTCTNFWPIPEAFPVMSQTAASTYNLCGETALFMTAAPVGPCGGRTHVLSVPSLADDIRNKHSVATLTNKAHKISGRFPGSILFNLIISNTRCFWILRDLWYSSFRCVLINVKLKVHAWII